MVMWGRIATYVTLTSVKNVKERKILFIVNVKFLEKSDSIFFFFSEACRSKDLEDTREDISTASQHLMIQAYLE